MNSQISMTVARDYRTYNKYEYVLFEDEEIVARAGFFASSAQAKRAGFKKAAEIHAARDLIAPELPL
jgi:hypothetical protein